MGKKTKYLYVSIVILLAVSFTGIELKTRSLRVSGGQQQVENIIGFTKEFWANTLGAKEVCADELDDIFGDVNEDVDKQIKETDKQIEEIISFLNNADPEARELVLNYTEEEFDRYIENLHKETDIKNILSINLTYVLESLKYSKKIPKNKIEEIKKFTQENSHILKEEDREQYEKYMYFMIKKLSQ